MAVENLAAVAQPLVDLGLAIPVAVFPASLVMGIQVMEIPGLEILVLADRYRHLRRRTKVLKVNADRV